MINVELSSIWSCVALPQLLACEKDLFEAHLHLRSNQPGGRNFLGWLGQPDSITAKTVHAIRKACEAITGQCDTLIVAGAGEGFLAAKAGIDALCGRGRNLLGASPRVLFAAQSLCGSDWLELCRLLEGHDFCLLLMSPSAAPSSTLSGSIPATASARRVPAFSALLPPPSSCGIGRNVNPSSFAIVASAVPGAALTYTRSFASGP